MVKIIISCIVLFLLIFWIVNKFYNWLFHYDHEVFEDKIAQFVPFLISGLIASIFVLFLIVTF